MHLMSTIMDKGMGPILCIAHGCLDRIVSNKILYIHEYECMSKLWTWPYILWWQIYDRMKYEYA